MSRQYSPRAFFRHAPNELLARYFRDQELLGDLDFGQLQEGNPAPLFEAWLELPATRRETMEADFRSIFEMACEKGVEAIIDEATFHLREACQTFTSWLASLNNHYEQAFATFLDHPRFWNGATRFYHADTLTSYWRKRKNLPQVPAHCDESSLTQLAQLIRDYFHRTDGKGQNCVVEPLRRNDLDYFFAYPEDYAQRSIEWVDNEFKPRPHNPAFEVIFVYSQQAGTLDLHHGGNRKAIEALQRFFAEAILKQLELVPDQNDERVYDLNPLRDRHFAFSYQPGAGIEDVRVRKVRLSSWHNLGDRLTLEADCRRNREAVYDLLDQISRCLALQAYHVTQVELVATLNTAPDKPGKPIPIRITYPNSCSLKYDETDLVLRRLLEQSGIEPKAPPSDTEA